LFWRPPPPCSTKPPLRLGLAEGLDDLVLAKLREDVLADRRARRGPPPSVSGGGGAVTVRLYSIRGPGGLFLCPRGSA
jgi:hypothetical protein